MTRWRMLMMSCGLLVMTFLTTGCTFGIYDGKRISNTGSTVRPSGYVTSAPAPGAKMRVQARLNGNGAWVTLKDNISINAAKSWTTADGTDLYSWNAGNMVIPAQYWAAGVGGSYARLRVQWYTGSNWYNTLMSRYDWPTCFTENFNGEGNTISYMLDNCFTHRGGEAYIYTQNYREGAWWCPAPASTLAKTQDHYMVQQLPSCAQSIVSNRMREKIDENMLMLHYEISHSTTNAASKNQLPNDGANTCGRQPGNDNQCELGGFFGGHERYIRRMERHVMVYDYPWMPKGKIPAWNGNTTIPVAFRNAEVSPNGNCASWTCDGWVSTAITNNSPGAAKPNAITPANVCGFGSVDAVAAATSPWHSNGHVWTGGHFGTFDSPVNPLFFLWHNAINDVWLDYQDCP